MNVYTDVPAWAAPSDEARARFTQPALGEPADLALDGDGQLYVMESSENGRVLRFPRGPDGRYAECEAIVLPSQQKGRVSTAIEVDARGCLFVASRGTDIPDLLPGGQVFMRERSGKWYLVDYGPFAEFI
ncbi:MAG: hypothetical protein GWO24_16595, partial [Akkermansiaceae bacterium]|nr:hypothetical protein [Akkermansiaceae bacterium]